MTAYTIDKSRFVFEQFDKEMVLINLEDGLYYNVSDTGTEVLHLLEQGLSVAEVLDVLSARYVNKDELPALVEGFVAELEKQGILLPLPQGAPAKLRNRSEGDFAEWRGSALRSPCPDSLRRYAGDSADRSDSSGQRKGVAKPMNATLLEGGRHLSDVIPPRMMDRLSEFVARIRARIQEDHDQQPENYEIAGLPVRFRFLDPRIKEQVTPAFQHLRTAMNIRPEFTVLLDGASSPLANLPQLMDWDGWARGTSGW